MQSLYGSALLVFAISVSLGGVILLTQRWHGVLSHDSQIGIQKIHAHPTPRIGGLPIMLALFIGLFYSSNATLASQVLVAALPAFLAGFIEDITKRVGVRERLVATTLSAGLACWLTGYWLTRANVFGLDALLQAWPVVAIGFTCFAVAGFANAMNIVDGFNGLASGLSLICLTAFAAIAYQVSDYALLQLIVLVMAAIAGFFVFNFPFGKLFLGDGGAYLLGFLLGWIAIMLPMRHSEVSVWASLLICFYPVTEVVFTIWRRRYRKHHPAHPDHLHLHSLIHSRVVKKRLTITNPCLKNAAVSPLVWLFSVGAGLFGSIFYEVTPILALLMSFAIALYLLSYFKIIRIFRTS
ncbi:MraY family glycosyltransferase [Parvibium lacunae]|uniref:Glycosyl transferase n=1 Tax=Parvibium lacunae TaxID=1888893 RepID=A0A368L1J9_9BURK|nr:glycosyltransferase [Parvibium lacunae]RCS57437.1 glycosyl transferase [Parvibium lacunae]